MKEIPKKVLTNNNLHDSIGSAVAQKRNMTTEKNFKKNGKKVLTKWWQCGNINFAAAQKETPAEKKFKKIKKVVDKSKKMW